MTKRVLRCGVCGSRGPFIAKAIEYHVYRVDGEGNLLEDLGCDETDTNDYRCLACDEKGKSGDVEWVTVEVEEKKKEVKP